MSIATQRDQELEKEFDASIFSKHIAFAFMSQGCDVNPSLVTYLLQQKHCFSNMSFITAQGRRESPEDALFDIILRTSFEYVHILEADVAPRKDTTARLLSHEIDVVTSPVYLYYPHKNTICLNVYMDEECAAEFTPKPPSAGLERIFATDFASVMIHRRVLETFKQTEESFTAWSPLIDERYKEAWPNIIFFAKISAFGFDVFVDWECEFATHMRYVSLDAPTLETYAAQRILDREVGSEQKRILFETPEGREKLGSILQRSGRDISSG